MAMHRPVLFGALLLMVCATGAQQKGVKETGLPRATAASGKQTYTHYCAACHGADARGDTSGCCTEDIAARSNDACKTPLVESFRTTMFSTCCVLGPDSPLTGHPICPFGDQSSVLWRTMTKPRCESVSRTSATTWHLFSKKNHR